LKFFPGNPAGGKNPPVLSFRLPGIVRLAMNGISLHTPIITTEDAKN